MIAEDAAVWLELNKNINLAKNGDMVTTGGTTSCGTLSSLNFLYFN